jgi:hypothetical protein
VVQAISILVILLIYAVVVTAQVTVVEWVLRELGPIGLVFRAAASLLHAVIAYGAVLGCHMTLAVVVHGDYRRGLLGPYTWLPQYCAAVAGLAVPWLPLLWRRQELLEASKPNGGGMATTSTTVEKETES